MVFLLRILTYSIPRGIFLFGPDNHALSLGGVECTLSLDGSLTRTSTGGVLGPNFGDGVPVRAHLVVCVCVCVCVWCRWGSPSRDQSE